jgi:hypothetical protein
VLSVGIPAELKEPLPDLADKDKRSFSNFANKIILIISESKKA